MAGVINNDLELEIREPSSNFSWLPYIHLCANPFVKDMNQPVIFCKTDVSVGDVNKHRHIDSTK